MCKYFYVSLRILLLGLLLIRVIFNCTSLFNLPHIVHLVIIVLVLHENRAKDWMCACVQLLGRPVQCITGVCGRHCRRQIQGPHTHAHTHLCGPVDRLLYNHAWQLQPISYSIRKYTSVKVLKEVLPCLSGWCQAKALACMDNTHLGNLKTFQQVLRRSQTQVAVTCLKLKLNVLLRAGFRLPVIVENLVVSVMFFSLVDR